MSVFEVIKRRRSIGKMTGERPTREQIEHLLEAATHAPNRHRVQPWKFIVLAGKARERLGAVMAESRAGKLEKKTRDKAQGVLNKERTKLLRTPLCLLSVAVPPRPPNGTRRSHIECSARAGQNMIFT